MTTPNWRDSGMVRMHFILTTEQADELRRVSEETGIPMTELARNAINLFLSTEAHSLKDTRVEYTIKDTQ